MTKTHRDPRKRSYSSATAAVIAGALISIAGSKQRIETSPINPPDPLEIPLGLREELQACSLEITVKKDTERRPTTLGWNQKWYGVYANDIRVGTVAYSNSVDGRHKTIIYEGVDPQKIDRVVGLYAPTMSDGSERSVPRNAPLVCLMSEDGRRVDWNPYRLVHPREEIHHAT